MDQPKCPSSNLWIIKYDVLYIIKYNSTVIKNKIMKFVAKLVKLEKILS